jgi:MFS family permease
MLGSAFSAALGGALLGPVLGAVARGAGPEPVFGGVGLAAALLALAAWREPAPEAAADAPSALEQLRALGDARLAAGGALIVLVGLFFGVLDVLGPLRLDHLGAGAVVVGGTFLVGAGLLGLVSPAYGRWFDRAGPVPLVRLGLVSGIVLAATLPWPRSAAAVAVLVAITGPLVGALWVPGMAVLSEGAEARGMDQAYAFALVNLSWAGAQVLGSAAGGRLAEATSDAVPYLAVAAMFATALAIAVSRTDARVRHR